MNLKSMAIQLARRAAKGVAANALHYSGARSLIAAAQRRAVGGHRVLILSYHRPVGTIDAIEGQTVPTMSISRATFRGQLEVLSKDYDLVSLDRALDVLEGKAQTKRDLAVITFDDGYRGVYNHAFPVMKEMGVPGIVYVPSGYVGTQKRMLHDRLWDALARLEKRGMAVNAIGLRGAQLDWMHAAGAGTAKTGEVLEALISAHSSERLMELSDALEDRLGLRGEKPPEGHLNMTWEMLRELQAHGVEIGAHTVDHTVLTHEPLASATRDLARCKADLEAGLKAPVTHFAYCNGWYSPGLAQALKNLGFRSAVTTEDLPNVPGVDPFALKRKVLWENSSAGTFGGFSRALAACQMDDVFGVLSLQTPVLGARPTYLGEQAGDESRRAHG